MHFYCCLTKVAAAAGKKRKNDTQRTHTHTRPLLLLSVTLLRLPTLYHTHKHKIDRGFGCVRRVQNKLDIWRLISLCFLLSLERWRMKCWNFWLSTGRFQASVSSLTPQCSESVDRRIIWLTFPLRTQKLKSRGKSQCFNNSEQMFANWNNIELL